LVLTLSILALSGGATVQLKLKTGFSVSVPFDEIVSTLLSATGNHRQVVVDFHNLIDFEVTVAGGTATWALGVTVTDVALASSGGGSGSTDLTTLENGVASIDSKVTDLNRLDDIQASVASIDAKSDALAALSALSDLDEIRTATEGTNNKAADIKTAVEAINSKTPNLGAAASAGSTPVVLATDQPPIQTLQIGTENGAIGGTQRVFVNNRRLQILAALDRVQQLTYADFGTKDQRITQIDYTSATFPGLTARKVIGYTLVSGKYRRDTITWTLI